MLMQSYSEQLFDDGFMLGRTSELIDIIISLYLLVVTKLAPSLALATTAVQQHVTMSDVVLSMSADCASLIRTS